MRNDETIGVESVEEPEAKVRVDPLDFWTEIALRVEKPRIAAQIRLTHLKLHGREDKETEKLLAKIRELEKYIDDVMGIWIKGHPAFPWFSQIKGVGFENIPKVVSTIDIAKADTVSSLWKYCGFDVIDGKAPKPTKGEKLHYNKTVRTMCWRLGKSLIKARGTYYQYYYEQKGEIRNRLEAEGIKILSTPTRGERKGKVVEPEGVIWLGHLDAMAMRKMIKLFLSHLWVVWREELGLPATKPYVIEQLGHSRYINPLQMVDKTPKLKGRAKK